MPLHILGLEMIFVAILPIFVMISKLRNQAQEPTHLLVYVYL